MSQAQEMFDCCRLSIEKGCYSLASWLGILRGFHPIHFSSRRQYRYIATAMAAIWKTKWDLKAIFYYFSSTFIILDKAS